MRPIQRSAATRALAEGSGEQTSPKCAPSTPPTATFSRSRLENWCRLHARFPLPWSRYVQLLAVSNPEARHFYETEALRGGWTIRQLDRQIGTQFYERTSLS